VCEDNEELRERQIDLTQELLKKESYAENETVEKGGTNGKPVKGMREMTELMEIMKVDHDNMVDTITLLKNKNDQLQKFADEKEEMFSDLKIQAEKAQNQFFTEKQRVDLMAHEKERVEHQLTLANDKLDSETLEREEVVSKERKLDSENQQLAQHLEHFKTAYNEISDRKAIELDVLTKEADDANLKERELRSKLEMQDREVFDLQEENRRLNKDLIATRADCENMLRIMDDYEN